MACSIRLGVTAPTAPVQAPCRGAERDLLLLVCGRWFFSDTLELECKSVLLARQPANQGCEQVSCGTKKEHTKGLLSRRSAALSLRQAVRGQSEAED